MAIIIITISILIITVLVWLLNKILPFQICPICAGVSLTWLLMMLVVLTNQLLITDYQLLITMLMGGTVVGMAYQGEKSLNIKQKNLLKFRTAIIIPGFILTYLAVNNISWLTLIIEVVVLLGSIYLFFLLPSTKKTNPPPPPPDNKKIAELEEKMKNCC